MDKIIVVEGLHDEMRIKSIYKDAKVITTGGREISDVTLDMIKRLAKDNEIIIFTDPDYPGDKIRERITNVVPNATQAFIPKYRCISNNKKKVGVEHASNKDIIEALNMVYKGSINKGNITIKDIFSLELLGSVNSAKMREFISGELNIGNPNAKTFLKRLNMFEITLSELKELVSKYENQH